MGANTGGTGRERNWTRRRITRRKISRSVLQELMQDRGAEFADKIHARDLAKVLQPMDARLRHFVCRGVIPQGCNAHAKGMRHVVASI